MPNHSVMCNPETGRCVAWCPVLATDRTVVVPDRDTRQFFESVLVELGRAIQKHGDEDYPDGTGSPGDLGRMVAYQQRCDRAAAVGMLTWRDILDEETAEVIAEKPGSPNIQKELFQVVACALRWYLHIKRRERNGQLASGERSTAADPQRSLIRG